jgi:hypothetical protein
MQSKSKELEFGVFGVDEKWLEFEGFRESKSMLLIP